MFVSMYKYKLSTNVHLLIICLSIFSLVVTSGTSSQDYDVCNQTIDELQNDYATVSAEPIIADDGVTFLGIRVNWTINSTYSVCNISSLRVELHSKSGVFMKSDIQINDLDGSLAFNNLTCYTQYIPSLISIILLNSSVTRFVVNGTHTPFGVSNMTSKPPLQVSQVCVAPKSLSSANIYWNPPPCRLNGVKIMGYKLIVCPTLSLTNNIDDSNLNIKCVNHTNYYDIDCDGSTSPYSCMYIMTDLSCQESYIIQVAAVDEEGQMGLYSNISIINTNSSLDDSNCLGDIIYKVTTSEQSSTTSINESTSLPVTTSKHEPSNGGNLPFSIAALAGIVASGVVLLCIAFVLVIIIILQTTTRRRQCHKLAENEDIDGDGYATIEMSVSTKKEIDDKSLPTTNCKINSKTSESDSAAIPGMAASETGDDDHDNYNHSEKTDNSEAIRTVKNILYESATEPKIIDYKQEMRATEGEQITLRVNFTGTPKPTITWTFKDNKMEGDYATELGSDGSLMFVCIEMKHAGRYNFVLSNCLGSAEGSVTLTVQDEDGESGDKKKLDFESRLVMVDDYGQYVASLHSGNNNTFILQYQSLVSGEEGKPIVLGLSELNKPLNRFRNIIAYDDHRIPLVPLADVPDCQNDYINASYINGYSQGNEYIASQGPLPNTVTDLWRLVWQEKVKIIAMVTNILEGWTKKCEQYWPEQGSEGKSFGPFKLTLVEEHIFADYTVRTIGIDHTGDEGSCRKVTQYHFTSWPDHGVPEYAGPILNYLRRIKAQHKPNKGPILVHCSAGVGRTGTLIAIDIALAQASKERQVDIPKIIVDMRKQRMKMVQTADQYAFIHDAVLETLICGDTQIPSSDLQRALEKLSKADKQKETGFEKHLKVLDQVSPRPIEVYCEAAMKYPDKNRNSAFLPPEKWRVTLKGETPDYIHASFANGYKQKKGFIIAQSPMENTVRDFVKMIYERECGVVVMLCGCEEGGVEMCAQYWPSSAGTMMKYGEFMVSTVSVNVNEGVTNRVITITDPKSGQVKKVTQFHLEEWSEKDVCSNRRALIDIIDQTGVVQRRTRNKPIVVHGNDTVSRVGVFCSLVNAIEMCKTEGVVDVFQVVKALRIQKPGAVLTVEQYQYIFDLVLLFLDSFSIYSNFK